MRKFPPSGFVEGRRTLSPFLFCFFREGMVGSFSSGGTISARRFPGGPKCRISDRFFFSSGKDSPSPSLRVIWEVRFFWARTRGRSGRIQASSLVTHRSPSLFPSLRLGRRVCGNALLPPPSTGPRKRPTIFSLFIFFSPSFFLPSRREYLTLPLDPARILSTADFFVGYRFSFSHGNRSEQRHMAVPPSPFGFQLLFFPRAFSYLDL